ncbi:hypothetical protein Y032_0715g1780 [Ancylostoma ceylanicum]|uniref:Uncharacterized protein n=1 Tax=Ancylostoma ceylanicum TaxID=53326 RepID=A0A016WF74_9BILA|nr:hypothetical protein Y032_0715g1780 [Ancylostoma ceylanicum]
MFTFSFPLSMTMFTVVLHILFHFHNACNILRKVLSLNQSYLYCAILIEKPIIPILTSTPVYYAVLPMSYSRIHS